MQFTALKYLPLKEAFSLLTGQVGSAVTFRLFFGRHPVPMSFCEPRIKRVLEFKYRVIERHTYEGVITFTLSPYLLLEEPRILGSNFKWATATSTRVSSWSYSDLIYLYITSVVVTLSLVYNPDQNRDCRNRLSFVTNTSCVWR